MPLGELGQRTSNRCVNVRFCFLLESSAVVHLTTEDDSVTLAETPVADVVFTPDSVDESGHLRFSFKPRCFHPALMSVSGAF